jgi:hypothetical protein
MGVDSWFTDEFEDLPMRDLKEFGHFRTVHIGSHDISSF